MPGYSFRNRDDIVDVLKMLRRDRMNPRLPNIGVRDPFREGAAFGPSKKNRITEGFIYYTPSGGISARSGTTPGTADCTPYYIDSSGDLAELTDDDGNSQTHEVLNIFASAIAGNTYITAKRVYNKLIADAEDCG